MVTLYALDACVWHYDRTNKNPNHMVVRQRVVPIDHERAFHGIEYVTTTGSPERDYADPFDGADMFEHAARKRLAAYVDHSAWDTFADQFSRLTDQEIASMMARLPDDLDYRQNAARSWKSDCKRFLAKRRDNVLELLRHARRSVQPR